MNKHKKLSRIVASLLAIITIISVIPLQTAMADTAASYVGGQGENIGGLDNGSNYYTFTSDKMGIRVSIVDQDGKSRIKKDGSNKKASVDILFFNYLPSGLKRKQNKFGNNEEYIPIPASKIPALIDAAVKADGGQTYTGVAEDKAISQPPHPYELQGNTIVSNGNAVKNWFIQGELGAYIESVQIPVNTNQIFIGSSEVSLNNYIELTRNANYEEVERKISQRGLSQTVYARLNRFIDETEKMMLRSADKIDASLSENKVVSKADIKIMKDELEGIYNKYLIDYHDKATLKMVEAMGNTNLAYDFIYANNKMFHVYDEFSWSLNRIAGTEICKYQKQLLNALRSRINPILGILVSSEDIVIPVYNGEDNFDEGNAYYEGKTYSIIDNEVPLISTQLEKIENAVSQNHDSSWNLANAINCLIANELKEHGINEPASIQVLGKHPEIRKTIGDNLEALIDNAYSGKYTAQNFAKALNIYVTEDYYCGTIIDELIKLDSSGKLGVSTTPAVDRLEKFFSGTLSNIVLDEDNSIGSAANGKIDKDEDYGQYVYVCDKNYTTNITDNGLNTIIESILSMIQRDAYQDMTIEELYQKIAFAFPGTGGGFNRKEVISYINANGLDSFINYKLGLSDKRANGFDNLALYQVGGYIAPFLDMKVEGKYIFDIELDNKTEYDEALALTGTGAEDRPSYRFVYGQYALVIEPLIYFCPTVGWPIAGWWTGSYFYGTPTNLASFSNERVASGRSKLDDDANHRPIRALGMSMVINEDVEYFNFGKIRGVKNASMNEYGCNEFLRKLSAKIDDKNNDKLVDDENYGYGWHVVTPNVKVKAKSKTQTADIPKIPTPHPAPDPSPLPDDSLDDDGKKLPEGEGGPGKIFNIVKYYETWDHEGLQEVQSKEYDARLTRTDNPQTITIMNEKEWKVEDWYTSPNDEPESRDWIEQDWKSQENRGDNNTYDEQKEENSIVQFAKPETLTTTVTLKKDEEKTLYVKLVKKLNAPVESDIDLEQSQLTKAIRTNNKNVNNTSYWGNYSFKIQVGPFKQTDV